MIPCKYCSYVGCDWARTTHGPLLGHYIFMLKFWGSRISNTVRKFIYNLGALDYSQIDNIEIEGIDMRDAPKFCDAYIASAEYKGRPMSEAQLERLNNDSGYVYECVMDKLY